MTVSPELLDKVAAIVGPKGALTAPADIAPHLEEQRGLYTDAQTPMVVKPATTEEAAAVVTLCAEYGVAMVPQGGNTGLVGGGMPSSGGDQIILSTARMNRVRALDAQNFTITVDAGCILADIQKAAADAGCLFPLSLGAEGSCQIGGNIAANAGGVNVLRYGNTRDLVLGIEAVLPDGRIWNGLKRLGKDNTGYALKHLFIGSEGTLGLITGATLKLFPAHKDVQTALCALDDLDAVTALLARARAASGDSVIAFELISRFAMDVADRHAEGAKDPFDAPHDWYVLAEFATASPAADLRGAFEGLLERAFEDGLIVDAVIAESLEQRDALWRIREGIPEAQKFEGGSIKHDVSVPVSDIPTFLRCAMAAVTDALPGLRPCPFGHVGDGNIHFNLTQPEGMDKQAFLDQWKAMNRIVHDIVADLDGSISAEHGIGQLKVDELARTKDPVELEMMRSIKRALDPNSLMNPGKLFR